MPGWIARRIDKSMPRAVSEIVRQSQLSIKHYLPDDASRWDRFVKHAHAATFCHQTGWISVLESSWPHRSRSIYAERDGDIVGVLPLFHVKSRWFGSRLVSTPGAVYGGVVADTAETSRSLIMAAQNLALDLGVDYLELRDTPLTDEIQTGEKFQRQDLYVSFLRSIFADEEALIRSFPRDIRRMIRQGPKHGLTSEIGREELLDDFYQVYATSVRNLGTPVFPRKLFAEFLRRFPDHSDILIIRQSNMVAGGVLSFYFRDTVLPYYGGAYPEFYRTGINNFMYWELMRAAALRGYSSFDFGRSKRDTGAYEFKRGWGMTERALPYKYFLVRAQEIPNLNPTNPKFKLMIGMWKHLPLGVTKLVGPWIVKNLP